MNAQDWFNCVQVLDSEGEANESWVTAIGLYIPQFNLNLVSHNHYLSKHG